MQNVMRVRRRDKLRLSFAPANRQKWQRRRQQALCLSPVRRQKAFCALCKRLPVAVRPFMCAHVPASSCRVALPRAPVFRRALAYHDRRWGGMSLALRVQQANQCEIYCAAVLHAMFRRRFAVSR